MLGCALLVVLVIQAEVNAQSGPLDVEPYKELLLEIHNDYRRREKSSNMQELVWDDNLSREAANWIRGCLFEHQIGGYGENLAFITNKLSIEEQIRTVMTDMYNEKDLYTYNDRNDCGAACHYTQLIWADTKRVGCAMHVCDVLTTNGGGSYPNAWYLACFYDPRGNSCAPPCPPYKRNPTCSECETGQVCNQGLCSDSTDSTQSGTIFTESSPSFQNGGFEENDQITSVGVVGSSDQCIDDDLVCPTWANLGQCSNWRSALCRLSCNMC